MVTSSFSQPRLSNRLKAKRPNQWRIVTNKENKVRYNNGGEDFH